MTEKVNEGLALFIVYLIAAGVLLPILLISCAASEIRDAEFDWKDALVIFALLLILL